MCKQKDKIALCPVCKNMRLLNPDTNMCLVCENAYYKARNEELETKLITYERKHTQLLNTISQYEKVRA